MIYMSEMPRAWLKTLSPLFDGDFAIAHLVLEDKYYADFYRGQSESGRFVILDNAFHELGRPLTPSDLLEAYQLINPSITISPDNFNDQRFTLESFFDTQRVFPPDAKLGCIVAGVSPAERAELFIKVQKHAEMLCFPFRAPRLEWFCDLLEKIPAYIRWPPRIHLLGVSELWEVKAWREKLEGMGIPHRRISVDTSKAIKFGIKRQKLSHTMETLRGGGTQEEIFRGAKAECMPDVLYNIAFLRKYL